MTTIQTTTRPIAPRSKVIAREPVLREEPKTNYAQPIGMAMIGTGGFGWLWASSRSAAAAFSPLALGFIGLLAAGLAVCQMTITKPGKSKVGGAMGILAPGVGIVGGGCAAVALGLTGWAATGVICGAFLLGMAAYKALT